MAKYLRFSMDGKAYQAVLQDGPLPETIAAMCPFEAVYTSGGSHEYYATLPSKARAAVGNATTKGHRNGLYFFEDWNALSLVIQDCDTAPYHIHYIGEFDEALSVALEKEGGRVNILCEAI